MAAVSQVQHQHLERHAKGDRGLMLMDMEQSPSSAEKQELRSDHGKALTSPAACLQRKAQDLEVELLQLLDQHASSTLIEHREGVHESSEVTIQKVDEATRCAGPVKEESANLSDEVDRAIRADSEITVAQHGRVLLGPAGSDAKAAAGTRVRAPLRVRAKTVDLDRIEGAPLRGRSRTMAEAERDEDADGSVRMRAPMRVRATTAAEDVALNGAVGSSTKTAADAEAEANLDGSAPSRTRAKTVADFEMDGDAERVFARPRSHTVGGPNLRESDYAEQWQDVFAEQEALRHLRQDGHRMAAVIRTLVDGKEVLPAPEGSEAYAQIRSVAEDIASNIIASAAEESDDVTRHEGMQEASRAACQYLAVLTRRLMQGSDDVVEKGAQADEVEGRNLVDEACSWCAHILVDRVFDSLSRERGEDASAGASAGAGEEEVEARRQFQDAVCEIIDAAERPLTDDSNDSPQQREATSPFPFWIFWRTRLRADRIRMLRVIQRLSVVESRASPASEGEDETDYVAGDIINHALDTVERMDVASSEQRACAMSAASRYMDALKHNISKQIEAPSPLLTESLSEKATSGSVEKAIQESHQILAQKVFAGLTCRTAPGASVTDEPQSPHSPQERE
eukprot:gnl/TRDRNA2_/TRDRNA2_171576_c2_seq3.p1 gnl/TRDRNA2_/TRDRNA2_171576_c2~~gnl/TRDRNA2_/TRDRNA2_171576_c2_seq3.p1  ORF type:complete len:646 (-),score=141.41 gnl/TRDRNA2_/TRDRNA2_171576_c2_seq3:113-1987(-)